MNTVLKNKNIQVSMKSDGAELTSIKLVSASGADIGDNEYLWQGDKEIWGRQAPVLFPIVGRLKNNLYNYNEMNYNLTQHGFARDREYEVIEKCEDKITYQIKSNQATYRIYPFKYEFNISYRIYKNTVFINYVVRNSDVKEMYFSLGAHPGFNCPLAGGQVMEDYYLEFEREEFADIYLIKNGYITDKKTSFLKNDKVIKLNKDLFINDALIFEDLKSQKVSLKSKLTSKFITIDFNSFKYLGIWSKPEGVPFICIEPWNGIGDSESSNGVLKDKKGIIKLPPDEEYSCGYSIEIG